MPMRTMTNLISANDRKAIRAAYECYELFHMERSLGDYTVVVDVVPGDSVWDVPMLIRVQQYWPNIYSTQYFKNMEEMEWIIRG